MTVTVPCPALARSALSTIAPLERAGRMNSGIDWTGWPVRPLRLAVTGPLVPTIVAENLSWVLPVFDTKFQP